MNEKNNRKYSVSDIVSIAIYITIMLLAVLLVEEIIRGFVTKKVTIINRNYFKSLIFLIISAVTFIILENLENKNRIFCNTGIEIALKLYLLLALNIFTIFDIYTIRVVKYVIFIINGALFAILGVSIYYNYLKNENNKVKAKAKMVIIFSLALTVAFAFASELIIYLINLMTKSTIQSFKTVIFDCLFTLLGSGIMNILFYLSLTKTKKFINYCLIDIQK